MTAELIRGFDRAEAAYEARMAPEPREDGLELPDEDALSRMGYAIAWSEASDWSWSLNGEIWGDGYVDAGQAWDAATEHWRAAQPEWCDRCGDQAVCPDCVGV